MAFSFSDINSKNIKKGMNYIKNNGVSGLVSQVRYKMSGPGLAYNGWYTEKHEADEEELARQREHSFSYEPLISILVPVYMTPEYYLRAMIDSVLKQTYSKWELCIVDGSQAVKVDNASEGVQLYDRVYSLETERTIRQYMEEDSRIKYKLMEENLGICGNINVGIHMADGDYIALINHDDIITEDALYCLVESLQDNRYDLIYTDEDKMSDDGTKFSNPIFKPDFSLDLLRSYNYIQHFITFKRKMALAIKGFNEAYDGAHIYEFLLRCSEKTGEIKHIPRILYHYRICNRAKDITLHKKEYNYEIEKKALTAHIDRLGIYATVSNTDVPGMYKVIYETPGNPFLSIVIVGGSHGKVMDDCLKPLFEKSRYYNFEVIIVDTSQGDREVMAYYKKTEGMRKNIRVITLAEASGYAQARNFGASHAKGDYILFLDSCTELISPAAISEMMGMCIREEVGIAGGTLYNENNTIFSSGYAIGLGGLSGRLYQGVRQGDRGYLAHNRVNCDYSAVSASCMMVKKALFEEVGGFSESFKSDFSDIDFCLKVRDCDKLVVCLADATWYYHKTIAGKPATGLIAGDRNQQEDNLFAFLWSHILTEGDPYYNPNFNRDGAAFTL